MGATSSAWAFPGIAVDPGFATVLVALFPILVAAAGFWLRNRFIRQRLVAALLEEVRIKLDRLILSDEWLERTETMLIDGVIPNIVAEAQADIIFDNHHQQLTLLPAAALSRITHFYKIDDFINRAMEEFQKPAFREAPVHRQLTHVQNVRMLLLPSAILAGVWAEFALSLARRMNPWAELAFARRHSSRWHSHRRPLAAARKIASQRLKKFRNLPYAACVWPKAPRTFTRSAQ